MYGHVWDDSMLISQWQQKMKEIIDCCCTEQAEWGRSLLFHLQTLHHCTQIYMLQLRHLLNSLSCCLKQNYWTGKFWWSSHLHLKIWKKNERNFIWISSIQKWRCKNLCMKLKVIMSGHHLLARNYYLNKSAIIFLKKSMVDHLQKN